MSLTTQNTDLIALKKLSGRAHTHQNFGIPEEGITSNNQGSYSIIFGNPIVALPATTSGLTALYSSNNIVERVKFQIDIIPDTQNGVNQSQGYRLKLPSDYNASGKLFPQFSAGTYLHSSQGKLQIIPSSFGLLKADGFTEYDPILYQTNGTTIINRYDPINWYFDPYSGVIFIQNPPAGYDVSATRPGYLEAFLYVGQYLDKIFLNNSTNFKSIATYASTGNITPLSGNATIDGFAVVTGDILLLKNQTTGTQNGTYVANTGGAWTRTTDLAAGTTINKIMVFVQKGNTQENTFWSTTNTTPAVIGSSTLGFVLGGYTANNGLIKSGGNIGLGGALTGNTTINLGIYNVTLTATTGTLKYAANYSSNFTPRSLVDKGYVTGLTSTGLVSANNGLRKSGTNISLGGALTGNTTINLGTYNIILTGATGTSGTLQYGADYSASYTPRTLVDKNYVDTNFAGSITFNNGLTKSGSNAHLGGTLTGDTLIDTTISGKRNFRIGRGQIFGGNTDNMMFGADHVMSNGLGGSNGWNMLIGESDFVINTGTTTGHRINNSIILGLNNQIRNNNNNSIFSATHLGGALNSIDSLSIGAGNAISAAFTMGYNSKVIADMGYAFGYNAQAAGKGSLVFGWANTYTFGSHTGTVQRVLTSGIHSINMSSNSTGQTSGHGALADYSAILGGNDGNIPSNSTRSIILGGNAIKATSATTDTVFMPKVRIGYGIGGAATKNNFSKNLVGRNSSTGELEFIDISGTSSIGNMIISGASTPVILDNQSAIPNVFSYKTNVEIVGQGTVTLTNGSPAVVGNGTNFLNATTGRGLSYWFQFWVKDSSGAWYVCFLSSIPTNTGATISTNYSRAQIRNGYNFNTATFQGVTGTYTYYIGGRNWSDGLYSWAMGNNAYADNFSTAIGSSAVATGQTAFAVGFSAFAGGTNSFAVGRIIRATGAQSFAGGKGNSQINNKAVVAAGTSSFNYSESNGSQNAGDGALAANSVILGGLNHNIPSDSLRSVVLGGNTIKASATTNDTVFMPRVRIGYGIGAALVTGTSTNFVTRNTTTGELEVRLIGSITGTTNAVNGLVKKGTNIGLGGTLTGDTTINTTTGLTLTFNAQTQGTPFISGQIGNSANVGLLLFKNQTGNSVATGLTDIYIGAGNGSASNGAGNISLGSYNLRSITASATEFNGGRNIAIGWNNQTGMTIGTHNIAIGRKVSNVKSGNYSYSIDIGYETNLGSVAASTFNDSHIAIGNWAMRLFTGLTNTSYITAIGGSAMQSSIARDGVSSIGIGPNALAFADFERYQIAIGDSAGKRSKIGRNNTMIGTLAGADMTGGSSGDTGVGNTLHNIAIGAHALQYANLVTKTTFVGTEAGSLSVSGWGHSGFGNWSLPRGGGSYNTGLGAFAGYHASLTLTGSTNTFIGYNTSYGIASVNNTIVIGTNLTVTGSSKIYLGNTGQTTILGSIKSGTTTNVLTKESNGEVRYRSISDLNNQLNGVIITATATGSSSVGYVGISATTTMSFYLPLTPKPFQRIFIADIKGNALSVNLTIDGNGKNINGSSTALINTNYGSVVVIYNGFNWSGGGFV